MERNKIMLREDCDYFEQTVYDGPTGIHYLEIREINWEPYGDPDYIDRVIFSFPITNEQLNNLIFQFSKQ